MNANIKNCFYVFLIVAISGGRCWGSEAGNLFQPGGYSQTGNSSIVRFPGGSVPTGVQSFTVTHYDSNHANVQQQAPIINSSVLDSYSNAPMESQGSNVWQWINLLNTQNQQYRQELEQLQQQFQLYQQNLSTLGSQPQSAGDTSNALQKQMNELLTEYKSLIARVDALTRIQGSHSNPATITITQQGNNTKVEQVDNQITQNKLINKVNDFKCFQDLKKVGLGGVVTILASFLYAGPFGALVAAGVVTGGYFIVPVIIGSFIIKSFVMVTGGAIVVLGVASVALAAGAAVTMIVPIAVSLVVLLLLSQL